MAEWELSSATMAGSTHSCIAVDWGTTNRRAWLLGPDGKAVDERADSSGLLAVQDRRFAESLEVFLGDWVGSASIIPVVIAGMAGSRMGWVEVPYVTAPAPLSDLAQNLMKAGRVAASNCWIVPGISLDSATQPEVMRGEECQILGALLTHHLSDGVFLLPGTHSKWARVSGQRLTEFRTYITGEMFNLLRQSGTLAQLMTGDTEDEGAFARGVLATSHDTELLNRLFSARSLTLFGRLEGRALASYVSGMLVGAEMRDALAAWPDLGRTGVICIGSAGMLARYGACANLLGLDLQGIDNKNVLPAALFWIAQQAGLVPK
ncbi:2-dehydro-3-deoxygalactonokinase [Dongia deserti]|uniref:2-dehydro-3-deoxygalactonokinase n=1 Tax=Dongia deserti TaxID=2268030 RepID=UPI0013C5147B|nr:2-dehydro-3-deoxygalactonokinase [Dongia deserti]